MIYMVNVSQDIEYLLQSKTVLHQIILGNGQLRDIQLSIVYNKQPDLIRKVEDQNIHRLKQVLDRKEIYQINHAYTDCPYDLEQLNAFFGVSKLEKLVTVKSYLIDCGEKKLCKSVMLDMSEAINMVQKLAKKAADKKAKE